MSYEPLYDGTGGDDARIYAHQCAHERQEHHIEEERICAGGGVESRHATLRAGNPQNSTENALGSSRISARPARALTNNEGDK